MTLSEDRGVIANGLVFEEGRASDVPAIMPIMRRAFSDDFGEAWNQIQCRSMLALPNCRLLLARHNREIVGFSISRSVLDEEELLLVAVDPDLQKLKLGTAILQKNINLARINAIAVMFLEVRSNNSAQHLYRKFGFEMIGNRPSYYTGGNGNKYDAITYQKLIG